MKTINAFDIGYIAVGEHLKISICSHFSLLTIIRLTICFSSWHLSISIITISSIATHTHMARSRCGELRGISERERESPSSFNSFVAIGKCFPSRKTTHNGPLQRSKKLLLTETCICCRRYCSHCRLLLTRLERAFVRSTRWRRKENSLLFSTMTPLDRL